MKKYVKPLMQSEAFVANEYIGACYYLACTECDATEYQKNNPFNMNGYEDMAGQGVYMYTNTINGAPTCTQTGGDLKEKPGWIQNLSAWDGRLPLMDIVEEIVWSWYKREYGSTTEVINFHPAVTGEVNKDTYPAHPNHS